MAFRTETCFVLTCDLCTYAMDEEHEGVEHYATEDAALAVAFSRGWSRLADGRVVCDDDRHAALLAADAVARFENAAARPSA